MDVVRRGSGSSELVLLDGVERSGDTVKVIRNSVISQGGTQLGSGSTDVGQRRDVRQHIYPRGRRSLLHRGDAGVETRDVALVLRENVVFVNEVFSATFS